MRTQNIHRRGISQAAAIGVALLLAATQGMAQTAKVATNSVQITADPAKKEVAVGFRLVDAVAVTSVSAVAEGVAEPLPATWEAWEGAKAPACAWLVVVDTSNPARAKTIEVCKDTVRSFLTGLPKTDAVAVFGLARDLQPVVPFDSKPEDALAAISTLKADGDASKTTLIYQNLREALPKLATRGEPRKAILLLTDGKDETGIDSKDGGAAAQEIEKNKLIVAAKDAGVVVHCLGYAEKLDDQKYFGALKEIALQTDGLFSAASVGSKELDKGMIGKLRGVMRGAGVAHVNVSKLEKPAALTITVKTAEGAEAVLKVPAEEVAKALSPKTAEPAPGTDKPKTPDELAKEKEEADRKIAAENAAKAAEDAADVAQGAADKAKIIAAQEPTGAANKAAKAAQDAAKAALDAADKAKTIATQKAADITQEALNTAQEAAKAAQDAAKVAEEAADEAKKIAGKAKEEAEAKKRLWIMIGSGVLLALVIAALLMVRASRRRTAEEEARLAEAARLAEEARIAEETRRAVADETKKAEAKPLAWLEMCDAQQTRHPVRIPSLKIGRGQHNDFVLRNDSVSGNHCVLNCSREGSWSITDLNSGNGVVLNGERVQQAELRHGDTIELGELKMRFLLRS